MSNNEKKSEKISVYLTKALAEELDIYRKDLKEDLNLEKLPEKSLIIGNLIDSALQFINST